MPTKPAEWWKSAVIYEIYPKSFQDTNGDGIGDIPGIIKHMDYFSELGVDGIWLTPIYASPQRDNGYDISDYRAIDPRIGTMEQFEQMVHEADARGITVIMDLVLNHTSDQHAWFLEARKDRNSPFHDYYIWREGVEGTPPNEMMATFGGSAWTWVPDVGQYYFNAYSPYQPDLNWANPKVREELYDMIRFWESKGVGGFRLDAIDKISKDPDRLIMGNGEHLHEYVREMSAAVFSDRSLVTVGEAFGSHVEGARLYSNPDGSELSMIFTFEHMMLDEEPGMGERTWKPKPLRLSELKRVFERWQNGLFGSGWNSLYWENHDQPRIVSRFGDDGKWHDKSAKMLAALLYGMQGTPYLYEGEEIGMTNIKLPIQEYDDIQLKNFYTRSMAEGADEAEVMEAIYAKGRDNARTPMQWTDGEWAGFSTVRPWLPVNPNYKTVNVERELDDPDSILRFYQKLITLRKEYKVFATGSFSLLDPDDENTFSYTRDSRDDGRLLVECNFTAEPQHRLRVPLFEGADVLISNYVDAPGDDLRPYEARILYAR